MNVSKNLNIFQVIESNFKNNFDKLGGKQFHFTSRLFLWKNDKFSRQSLLKLKDKYIGRNSEECSAKIIQILNRKTTYTNCLFYELRKKYFIKYPLLRKYKKILFKYLFSKTIYGIDIRHVIESLISDQKFLKLKNELENDHDAITILSTHAINFFYSLDFYMDSPKDLIKPNFFLRIVEENAPYMGEHNIGLLVYLLTHCIVGESAFYSRPINRELDIYIKMFYLAEKIILNWFDKLSLDILLEFLVCARICGVKTKLRQKIITAAEDNFIPKYGYIVESTDSIHHRLKFTKTEHRNVLAIMVMSHR